MTINNPILTKSIKLTYCWQILKQAGHMRSYLHCAKCLERMCRSLLWQAALRLWMD